MIKSIYLRAFWPQWLTALVAALAAGAALYGSAVPLSGVVAIVLSAAFLAFVFAAFVGMALDFG